MKQILTDEEIAEVMDRGDVVEGNRFLPFAYARAIEAAILEKIGERVAYLSKDNRIVWETTHPQLYTPLYAIPFIKEGER